MSTSHPHFTMLLGSIAAKPTRSCLVTLLFCILRSIMFMTSAGRNSGRGGPANGFRHHGSRMPRRAMRLWHLCHTPWRATRRAQWPRRHLAPVGRLWGCICRLGCGAPCAPGANAAIERNDRLRGQESQSERATDPALRERACAFWQILHEWHRSGEFEVLSFS